MSGELATLDERGASGGELAIADHRWQGAPRGWYVAVAGGALPLLVLGMVASALADRLAFAGWGLVAGVGHALILRGAWQRGWMAPARAALTLAWAALALVVFGALVAEHQEILDLGYRALLWPLYAPALARPRTAELAAAALAIAAVAAAALARRARADRARRAAA